MGPPGCPLHPHFCNLVYRACQQPHTNHSGRLSGRVVDRLLHRYDDPSLARRQGGVALGVVEISLQIGVP